MSRPSIVIALFLGSMVASPASAQSWADFGSAFKLFPCNDGWSGCRVGDTPVQPDLVPDSTGLPSPSHMRVGWFDLEPTNNFSPFSGLSEYTGQLAWDSGGSDAAAAGMEDDGAAMVDDAAIEAEMTDEGRAAVAAAEEANAAQEVAAAERQAADRAAAAAQQEQEARARAEEQARKRAEEEAKRAAELERQQKEAEARAANDAAAQAEADRLRKEAEAAAKAAAEAEAKRKAEEEARRKAEEEARKAEEEARKRAEEEAKRKAEADAKRKAEEEARRKAEEEARKKAEEEARKKAEEEAARKAAEEAANDGTADAADGTAGAAAVSGGGCTLDSLVGLEPKAMLGKLDDPTVAACEATLSSTPKMTDKGKISRILMVNAFSKGDKATWEKLVKRHLDEIDQSDPDLCYKYALHLSKQGAGRASGVIRWADVALENRTRWTGDTYTSRVFSLYKLRAAASQKLWQAAEQAHAQAPSDDTGAKVDKYRSMTKVMAREWYEYAKVAGKDTTKALQLCMSAAGTKDYCEAG